jgi:hypothetical protein
MADMFIVNTGKAIWFPTLIANATQNEDYVVDLFTNNVTVSDTTVASGLTPGSWTGYAQVAVARSTFTYSLSGVQGQETSSVVPQFNNTSGGSVNVYGWMMRGATSGTLYAAANFTVGTPVAIPSLSNLQLNPFRILMQSF